MSLDIVKKIVKALDDKKGNDIQIIKIEELTIVADYFVICTANSNTHVRALADEVEYQLGVGALPYVRLEGTDSNEWKVVDCHDVIVHIFSDEAREFYKLEKLWSDAQEVDIDEIIK